MDFLLEQINSMGKTFVGFAGPMLIQSSVLIIILFLVEFLLRKKVRAVVQYWLGVVVLLQLALPPALSLPVIQKCLSGSKAAYAASACITTELEAFDATPLSEVSGDFEAGASGIKSGASVAASITWQGTIFLIWLAVVIAMGLMLLQRAFALRTGLAQAERANWLMNDALEYYCRCMGVTSRVHMKVSTDGTGPAVCGFLSPVILVPNSLAAHLGSRHLRAVLLHELAHVKRGDLWVNFAQTVLQVVYFYNPLLWLANLMIRRIRERAVDETVLRSMGKKVPWYPQTLAEVADLPFKRAPSSLGLIGVVESKSLLARQLEHILDHLG